MAMFGGVFVSIIKLLLVDFLCRGRVPAVSLNKGSRPACTSRRSWKGEENFNELSRFVDEMIIN